MHIESNLVEKIRIWTLARIELHIAFENIQQEKKNMINMATKTILNLLSSFVVTDSTYEQSIAL